MNKKQRLVRSHYPEKKRIEVLDDYLNSNLTLRDLADKHEIPFDTMMKWHTNEGWSKQKQELQRHIRSNFEAEHLQIVMKNQAEVAQRHLDVSKKIEEAIAKLIDKHTDEEGNVTVSARELSDLAKALKNSGDIGARIVQLDRVTTDKKQNSVTIGTALIQHTVRPQMKKVVEIPDEDEF